MASNSHRVRLCRVFWAFCLLALCASSVSAQVSSENSEKTTSAPSTRIKTIYVVPSSHWDLGFLAPPEEILPRLKPHIDEVIANAKADPEFRWTIESAWQVREWLSRTSDPKQIQEFVDLVKRSSKPTGG